MVSLRPHSFRLTTRRARALTSSLFGLTFFACVLTVSASNMLPCPAHLHRGRFADDGNNTGDHQPSNGRRAIVVEKRPRRWIEERHPRL
jgi:cytochrome c oxidase assembly factor 2